MFRFFIWTQSDRISAIFCSQDWYLGFSYGIRGSLRVIATTFSAGNLIHSVLWMPIDLIWILIFVGKLDWVVDAKLMEEWVIWVVRSWVGIILKFSSAEIYITYYMNCFPVNVILSQSHDVDQATSSCFLVPLICCWQIDARALRAVSIEHCKDVDAAVVSVLEEIIPFFTEKSTPNSPLNQSVSASESSEGSSFNAQFIFCTDIDFLTFFRKKNWLKC